LLEPGDVVLTESPTYPINLGSFRAHGARVIGVPMDGEGMRVDLLEQALARLAERGSPDGRHRVKLVYVIPDAQNPTGITMSAARRRALLRVAAAHGVPIVEDAPYRGVDYEGAAVPTVCGLAREEAENAAGGSAAGGGGATVLHVGSFAKTIAPGLRAGYLVAPPRLIDTCVMLKQGEDFCTSGLVQLVVARLLRDGTLEATVERLRTVQGRKLATMLEALETHLGDVPGITWTRPRGGLFVWLTLPAGSDTDALLERAIAERVAFIPGPYFYPPETLDEEGHAHAADPPTHELRLNFSDPAEGRIGDGIATLARLVRQERSARPAQAARPAHRS
ncbi:MAG: PLP-dependent aminotransferase family protein, partial [Candidatus Eiseniibacteriota bacterium]